MIIFGTGHFIWLARLFAAMVIGLIAYLTLAHVGIVYSIYFRLAPWLLHVGIGKYVAIEHFAAFALLGALCYLACPKRILLVCVMVFGTAVALELLQNLTPDRHGTFLDAAEKLAGGACGILLSKIIVWIWQRPIGV